MSIATQISTAWIAAAFALALTGCDAEPSTSGATSARPAATSPATSAAPTPTTAPTPTASASAAPVTCPAGSTGEGTLAKPCEAKGNARMMEVTWTGKMTDTGPSFRVTSKAPAVILYGKIVVYFYDKKGKQLEVKDTSGKPRPHQTCPGNIFGGVMNPAEKAVLTFSCVKKEHVPEGTDHVEAEMETVGFANATGVKSEYYWRNADLAPDARPKGGVK